MFFIYFVFLLNFFFPQSIAFKWQQEILKNLQEFETEFKKVASKVGIFSESSGFIILSYANIVSTLVLILCS